MTMSSMGSPWKPDELALVQRLGFDAIRRRAKQGLRRYMYLWGLMRATGTEVPLDIPEAAEWWTRAAQAGCSDSAFHLGALWAKGTMGSDPGDQMAYLWLRKGADLGSPAAMAALANLGTRCLLRQENETLRKKSLKEHVRNLVFRLFSITPNKNRSKECPLVISPEECLLLYQKAMDMGHGAARYFFALHLFKGWGCKPDIPQAESLWNKDSGSDPDSAWMLALSSDKREGMTENTWALVYQAAELCHAEAQHSMGVRYYDGSGVAVDKKTARMWFMRSASQNYGPAQAMLADLLLEEGDVQEAMNWSLRAYDNGEYTPFAWSRWIKRFPEYRRAELFEKGKENLDFFRNFLKKVIEPSF